MKRVLFCQHVEWLRKGDGTGNSVLALGRLALTLGYDSMIAARHIETGAGESPGLFIRQINSWTGARLHRDSNDSFERIYHVLHYAGYGYPLDFYIGLPGYKILIYHNITPARFFIPYRSHSRKIAKIIAAQIRSRVELRSLSSHVDLALGVSHFNEKELRALGFPSRGVLPNLVEFSHIGAGDTPKKNNFVLLGTAGRIAPNKNLEHTFAILYFLRKIRPGVRLRIVGSFRDFPEYYRRLLYLRRNMGLEATVEFAGFLSETELGEFYRGLDYYISTSLHEGFGVPLLEAMRADAVVIARKAGAVAEVMGGAGVLLGDTRAHLAAEWILEMEENPTLKESVLARQRRRVAEYLSFPFADTLRNYLEGLGR